MWNKETILNTKKTMSRMKDRKNIFFLSIPETPASSPSKADLTYGWQAWWSIPHCGEEDWMVKETFRG
jgi:phage terminase large subunit GpA-like protein